MAQLFGTDGVRGFANKYPLDGKTAFSIAQSAARQLMYNNKKQGRPLFIGKDTRISGDMLEHAVAAGIASVGAEARLLGIVPTPAVAFITRELQGMGGIMISASHNPFADNGIKIFGADGYKLSDAIEAQINKEVVEQKNPPVATGADIGQISSDDSSISFWLNSLAKVAGENTGARRLKIALDCANGSLASIAPAFFSELGYSVDAIGVNPDGCNINKGVGSTYMSSIIEVMKKEHFDIGFSFDGDADRVIAVSNKGDVIDGDYILAITAKYLKQRDKLSKNTLVTTVMSNLGLDLAMKNLNIKVLKTRVGDRYVLEEMQRTQSIVGGEQSGHIILSDHSTTGDGLLTACYLLRIMRETGASLRELSTVMSKMPQVLVNIRVKNKQYDQIPEIVDTIRTTEKKLSGKGRLLVRPSGTEDLLRVMAEGPDEKEIRGLVDNIAKTISTHLCQ